MADVEQHTGPIMPLTKEKPGLEYAKITSEMQQGRVYHKLRTERMNAKREGFRKKRAAEEAAEKEK